MQDRQGLSSPGADIQLKGESGKGHKWNMIQLCKICKDNGANRALRLGVFVVFFYLDFKKYGILLSLTFFMEGKMQVLGSYAFPSSWYILSNSEM